MVIFFDKPANIIFNQPSKPKYYANLDGYE